MRAQAPPRISRRSLIVGAAAIAGCKRPSYEKDARIVSVAPSMTEAVFAIGAGPLLVGRSQQCDFPPEVTRLPSVGGYGSPDIERIVALRPALVIGDRPPPGSRLESQLRSVGVESWFPPMGSVAEIRAMLVALGDRLGYGEIARRRESALRADVEAIATWAAGRRAVSAVMVLDLKPLYVVGPGSFPDELIRVAGGRNAVGGTAAYPTIDIERLVALDPEVIIDAATPHGSPSRLVDAEGWAAVPAVRRHAVRMLDSAAALRPGPRIAQGLASVARALHGEDPPRGGG